MWFVWLLIGVMIGFGTCTLFASRVYDRGHMDGMRYARRCDHGDA